MVTGMDKSRGLQRVGGYDIEGFKTVTVLNQ